MRTNINKNKVSDIKIFRDYINNNSLNRRYLKSETGFTLIEVMITIVILGILVAIGYPSYQSYLIKTHRVEMMGQMQDVVNKIESQKLATGKYSLVKVNDINGGYPDSSDPIYNLVVTPVPLTSNWVITATPLSSKSNKDDGNLTINSQGVKCRIIGSDKRCGINDEWNN